MYPRRGGQFLFAICAPGLINEASMRVWFKSGSWMREKKANVLSTPFAGFAI